MRSSFPHNVSMFVSMFRFLRSYFFVPISSSEIGKTVGGTKGNKVLDFVSGSPNIPFIVQEASNVFDYDELTKYGYSVSKSFILYTKYHIYC